MSVADTAAPTELPQAETIEGSRAHLFGISAALVTPFTEGGGVDNDLVVAHVKRVMAAGANGVTLFGTTGEGASIGMEERSAMVSAVLDAGVPAKAVTVCVVACAMEQALQQTRDCTARGVRRILLTPPFYFKGVSDAALYDWFETFIETLDQPDIQIILYHIPQVTGVGLSVALIRKLKDNFKDAIFGVKDSSGDWANVQDLLKHKDLAILVGDERLLGKAAPLGGAGSISGLANLIPARLARLIRTGQEDAELVAMVDDLVSHPVTPMVKAMVAAQYGEDSWRRVRTPLDAADTSVASDLTSRLSL